MIELSDRNAVNSQGQKRRIQPTLLTNNNSCFPNIAVNNPQNNNNLNANPFPITLQITPEMFNLPERTKSKVKKEPVLETKLICLKLEQFKETSVYLLWENKKHENQCHIALQLNDGTLYANRFENRQIQLFTYNNLFYAFYDTQNHLNIYTLFNNLVLIYLTIDIE
jgi:hypothetical protein